MIIRGAFVGDAPYFSVHLRSHDFQGMVWLLADTGASRTTLLDRDTKLLGVPDEVLKPATQPMIRIGGSVRSFLVENVEISMASDQGDFTLVQDLWVVQHDLGQLPSGEVARILRLPSLLGRDLINQFRFVCSYRDGTVQLQLQIEQ